MVFEITNNKFKDLFSLSSSTIKGLIPLMEYEQCKNKTKNNLVESRKSVYHLRERNNVKNKL